MFVFISVEIYTQKLALWIVTYTQNAAYKLSVHSDG